jgi:hypothetical protein
MVNVPLVEITGDENPNQNIGFQYRPVPEVNKHRWVGVAVAKKVRVCLPPVQVLHIDSTNYVRDGHHGFRFPGCLAKNPLTHRWSIWIV